MGQDFICQAEIVVNKDGVKFRNANTEETRDDYVADIMNIQAVEYDELNVSSIYKAEVSR